MRCSKCGSEYVAAVEANQFILDADPLSKTFGHVVESLGGDISEILVCYCSTCDEQVLVGPRMTFEGTIE